MLSRVLVALLVALSLAFAGCKGADPKDDPTPGTSGSPSPTATDPTDPASPTPTPATGPKVENDAFSYHLPGEVEWRLGRAGTSASYYDEDTNRWRVVLLDTTLQAGNSGSLDEDWQLTWDVLKHDYTPPVRRGQNRTVNGVEGWTAQTVEREFNEFVYAYGAVHERQSVTLIFTGPDKSPKTREWIEAVLASVEWK